MIKDDYDYDCDEILMMNSTMLMVIVMMTFWWQFVLLEVFISELYFKNIFEHFRWTGLIKNWDYDYDYHDDSGDSYNDCDDDFLMAVCFAGGVCASAPLT